MGGIMAEHLMVDLFSGCGGLGLGMEQAGFKVSFASDIDPKAAKTYLNNRRYLSAEQQYVGDIKVLNDNIDSYRKYLENIELVCGGPPCQGFSMANRQRIIDDPRNVLYKEYLRFLAYVRPNFFVMENVSGMLNKITEILEDFETVLDGEYDVSYALINAKYFGVPQNRKRLIVIGNRVGKSSELIINNLMRCENEAVKYNLHDAIYDLPVLQPKRMKYCRNLENDDIGYFEREYEYIDTAYRTFINNGRRISKLYNHINRYNNDRDLEIYKRLPQGADSLHESISDIMPYHNRNEVFKDKYYKLDYSDVSKTITSHMQFDCHMYIHPEQIRGLSPREAARIQTFPDDFIFYGPQNSWYKQIGNAVPVKLAEAIGKEIIKNL